MCLKKNPIVRFQLKSSEWVGGLLFLLTSLQVKSGKVAWKRNRDKTALCCLEFGGQLSIHSRTQIFCLPNQHTIPSYCIASQYLVVFSWAEH